MSEYSWAKIIVANKDFLLPIASRHNVLKRLDGEAWSILLQNDFNFYCDYADKFSAWIKLDSSDWRTILS